MRFPPLKALRSFEAAARHLSFSKAAEELFVTPAAVSHQVKALEDWLGVILFKRLNRAVILTNEGQNYVMGVRNGLKMPQALYMWIHYRHSQPGGCCRVSAAFGRCIRT